MALILDEMSMLRWITVDDAMRDLVSVAKVLMTENEQTKMQNITEVDELILYSLYQSLDACLYYSFGRIPRHEDEIIRYIALYYGAIVENSVLLVRQTVQSYQANISGTSSSVNTNAIKSITQDGRSITFRDDVQVEDSSSSSGSMDLPTSIKMRLPKQRARMW